MLNSVIEVAIGLVVLFSVLSLVSSGVQELLSAALALRAKNLANGVRHLVGRDLAGKVYGHPLIESLYRKGRLPSYVPGSNFVLAFLDNTVPSAVVPTDDPGVAERVTEEIERLPAGRVRRTLEVLWRDANNDVRLFRFHVETWFDHTMDRVSGWYKRQTQIILVALGLLVAVGLNVNTLSVTQRLWVDGPVRSAVVDQAKKLSLPPAPGPGESLGEATNVVEDRIKAVSALNLPLGWGKGQRPSSVVVAVLGWLITAVALAMGAPFWFDLLGKVAGLRTTGKPVPTHAQPGPPASATG